MKRIFSVLIVLSILLMQLSSIMPVSASAATTGDVVYIDEDFSDTSKYTVGTAYTHAQLRAINKAFDSAPGGWVKDPNSTYTVKQVVEGDSSKGNYLSVGPCSNGHAYLATTIDEISTGTLVIETKLRSVEDSAAGKTTLYHLFFNNSGTLRTTLKTVDCGALTSNGDNSPIFYSNNKKTDADFTKDDYGFYSIRTIWNRATTEDTWNVKIYNAYDGKLVYERTDVDASYKPSAVMFCSTYYGDANIDLANLKVYKPGPISLTADGYYNVTDKTVSFTPSKALTASSVANATVVVKDSSGAQVTTGTAQYVDGKVVLTTALRLTGTEYTATFTGLVDSNGVSADAATVAFAINQKTDKVLLDEDFSEGYELGRAYTHAEIKGINSDFNYAPTGWATNSVSTYTVNKVSATDDSKGNCLSVSPASSGHQYLGVDIDTVSTGTLVVESKMRVDSTTTKQNLIHMYLDESCSYKTTLKYQSSKLTHNGDLNPTLANAGDDNGYFTPDSDGFYYVKTVWTRAAETDTWTVSAYDMNANKLLRENTAVDNNFKPSGILFWSTYGGDKAVELADLKIYIPAEKETVEFSQVTFKSAGVEVEALDFTAKDLSAEFTVVDTKGREKSYVVFLAVYNSDGTLVDVDSASGTTTDEETPITLSLDGLELTSGAYAKVIYLNNISNLVPYGAAEVLPAEGFSQDN